MNKNILIVGLVVIVIVETGYIVMKKESAQKQPMVQGTSTGAVSAKPSGGPKPVMVGKGTKLSDSPLAKYAYKIVPGPMGDDAKKALTGFTIKTQTLADGSTQVDLVPKDSDDQYQRYVVKSDQTFYFVEMTPADDKADSDRDINYRDDYGIITDSTGAIQ